jgi:hypothetical protein
MQFTFIANKRQEAKMKTDLHRIKITLPVIEQEITNLLAALYETNPELKLDDDFKSDVLEGSTDLLEIINKLLFDLILTESYIDSIKLTRARIEQREKKLKGRQEVIRSIIRRLLEAAELRKINVPNGTASLTSKPQSVEIVDEGLLPDEFFRITKSPNKTLIGERLKAGEDVPGAQLSNGGETLTIR